MFYFDKARTIREQTKAVKLSIPKILILLLANIILIPTGVFLGIIGAKISGIVLLTITLVTLLLIPVGKLKSEPIVWTIHKNKTTE